VPFDPQPPPTQAIGDVVDAVFGAMLTSFNNDVPRLVGRLGSVYGFINPVTGALNQVFNPLAHLFSATAAALVPGVGGLILGNLAAGANPFPLVNLITRIGSAADTLDVALDAITKPLRDSYSTDLAQPFLTGFLGSTLGTAKNNPAVAIGTTVGNVGFPMDGLIGAGIEIALPVRSAFEFVQTQILDAMHPELPFFGYVSIRICPNTNALLGMPQWGPLSVMIEVVAFGDDWGRTFVSILQTKTLAAILSGTLDAMLHWGLENDQLTAAHLAKIPALQLPTPDLANDGTNTVSLTKLQAFKMIRDFLRSANGTNAPSLFRTFDNAFTTRLGL
jgi:hypothetical protein